MHVCPLVSSLDLIFPPSCMATTAISPNDLRCFMYFTFLLKNNVYGGFVLSVLTMMLSNFVAVQMTSHQNFLVSCWFNPAWIIIALALPIKFGICLSTTEFSWGVPGAVNSKITSSLCLSHSFWRLLFSQLLSSLTLSTSILCLLDKTLIHIGIIAIWSLFLVRRAVTAVTELIHCNQPMSFSSSTFIFERTDINKYPVPWSAWYFLHLFLTSHGGNFSVKSIFMYFAVGFSKCSPVCPVIWWNFHIEIFVPGSIPAWAWSTTL